jgi:aminomethyltransferase
MLKADGKFIDDCVIYYLAVNSWMVVIGTVTGMESLVTVAAGKDCSVLFDDDLQDMSLEDLVSVNFLAKEIPEIRDLA